MSHHSKVSVIIIFLNAESFIEDAVKSVLAQTYKGWELLFVDDGSNDNSSQIARSYTSQYPEQIHYFVHPNHQNLGMSASRNLGIYKAKGEYIAFLDADDIWLPGKIEHQVKILDSKPEAGMVYGNTLYWYSWTDQIEDKQRDHIPKLGIAPNTLVNPPSLLPLYLSGKAAVPCTCSVMVRREVLERIGGFEEAFHGMYEDQVFYAKVSLTESIFVSGECLDQYRQHPESLSTIAVNEGRGQSTRTIFLNWLMSYLLKNNVEDPEIWLALRRESWLNQQANTALLGRRLSLLRWMKKWTLRIEEWIVPSSIRTRYWTR